MAMKDLGAAIVLRAVQDLAVGPLAIGHADYASAEKFLLENNYDLGVCCDLAGINASMVVRASQKLHSYVKENGYIDKNKVTGVMQKLLGTCTVPVAPEIEDDLD